MTKLFADEHGRYERGVHMPLIRALGDTSAVRVVVVDRYSKEDADSLESQVERHLSLYPTDLDAREYRRMIEDGMFTDRTFTDPRIGAVSPADIHHLASSRKRDVVFAKVGRTLFLRVQLSAAQRDIRREDGSQANVYTVLIEALVALIDGLEEVRWGVDSTRAGREAVNWSLLIRRHQERNVAMTFAGARHDPTNAADRLKLMLLGAVTSEDDPTRRRRLVSGKIVKYLKGEFCLAPELLPYGWVLPTNHRGVVARGTLPVGDLSVAEALGEFHRMYGAGATHTELVRRLAQLETEGKITRRSGLRHEYTFADALTSPDSPAVVSAIVARMLRAVPPEGLPMATAPDREAVFAYVAGGDPSVLFDLPQRLAIARVEALRTGVYLRVLRNDIPQRDLEIAGVRAITFDPADDKGFFFMETPWPAPIDPATGEVIERFGIPDEVLRKSAARMLLWLGRGHEGKQGGQAHVRAERRPFLDFGRWTDGGFAFKSVAAPGAREGLVNSVVLRRDATVTGSWGEQQRFHSKYAVGTFRQQALAVAVADALTSAMVERLDDVQAVCLGMVDDSPEVDAATAEATRLRSRADEADAESAKAEKAAEGARQMAALLLGEGEVTRALDYERDAAEQARRVETLRAQAAMLRAQADDVARQAQSHVEADVSAVAYLVAGLRRAASTGKVPDLVGRVADRLLTNWRLVPDPVTDPLGGSWIDFTVDLQLPPLGEGPDLVIGLRGRVPNVRTPRRSPTQADRRPVAAGLWTGPRIDHAGALFFRDGHSIEQVSLATQIPEHRLVRSDLRTWLERHGITTGALISALIDHPVPAVRQAVFQAVSQAGDGGPDLSGFNTAWVTHVAATYADPKFRWGYAACPDDLSVVHQVLATVDANGPTDLSDLARVLNVDRKTLRCLVTPARRIAPAGFLRPQYLDWADRAKTAVTRIVCPHQGCTGYATRAVLLPETSASGYGVICTTCRRMPNTTDPKWAGIVFPPEYVAVSWSASPGRPRPAVGRTVAVDTPAPAATAPVTVKHRYPGRVKRARRGTASPS